MSSRNIITITRADAGAAPADKKYGVDNVMGSGVTFIEPGNDYPSSGYGSGGGGGILVGLGDPADADGLDGEVYLDQATYTLWGPKADGTWTGTGRSLIGPTGPAGTGTEHTIYVNNAVTDYGADPSGISDSKAAIQAALDAAYAAGGGIVFLPKGVYKVTAPGTASAGCLSIKDNVSLIGAGIGSTVIRCADFGASSTSGIVRTPSGSITKNVLIQDLTLDGNLAAQTGVGNITIFFCGVTPGNRTDMDQNIRLIRVEAMGGKNGTAGATVLNAGYGFDPHEMTTGIIFQNCIAHDNQKDGFVLDGQTKFLVDGCFSYANGRHGFNFVTESFDGVVKSCLAWSNGTLTSGNDFIVSEDSHDILLDSCRSTSANIEGIKIRRGPNITATRVTVKGCVVSGARRSGITLNGANENQIVGNTIYDAGQANTNTYHDIAIIGDDGNSGTKTAASKNYVNGNYGISTKTAKTKWGIYEEPSFAANNNYFGNLFSGNVSGEYAPIDATSTIRTGANGTPGTNGTNGNVFLIGSGVPSSGTGNDGDAYFDKGGLKIYGPKTAGAWDTGTSVAGTTTPAGAPGEFQFGFGGVFTGSPGWKYDPAYDRARAINPIQLNNANAPGNVYNNTVLLHARAFADKFVVPAWTGPLNVTRRFGTPLAARNVALMTVANIGATSMSTLGISATSLGTGAGATASSATKVGALKRVKFRTAASANSSAGVATSSSQNHATRGSAADCGGFHFTTLFNLLTTGSNSLFFAGLTTTNTASIVDSDYTSALNNFIGIGRLPGDTNLKVYSRASGTVTSVDLGSDFAWGNGLLLEVQLLAAPNDSAVHYLVRDLNSGKVASGSVSANLPGNTIFLCPQVALGNGSDANQQELEINSVFLETDF